jgi:hypothetical protein
MLHQLLFPIGASASALPAVTAGTTPHATLSEEILEVDLLGVKHTTILGITSYVGGTIYGYIDSGVVNCRFRWNAGGVLPVCTSIRRASVPAPLFVELTIQALGEEALDYNPSNIPFDDATGSYVSRGLIKGHLRKPYIAKKRKSPGHTIVRGTLVNEDRINPLLLPGLKVKLESRNRAAEMFKGTLDITGFSAWKAGI